MFAHKVRRLGLQYAKFGGVGLTATAVHVAAFTGLIEFLHMAPMAANLAAFSAAVLVSFFGHFYWTFTVSAARRAPSATAFLRFVVAALTGLALNSLIVYTVDEVLHLSYVFSIVGFVVVTPPVVFVMSKYWAFVGSR